jgi:hypothetical protein
MATLLLRNAVFHAFLDRYYPYTPPAKPTLDSARADAARVAGWYEASRRNDSSLSLLYMFGQVPVAPREDGTLVVPFLVDYAGKPMHWREIGPLQYREVNGQEKLDFVADKDGNIRYWATTFIPGVEVFQRVPGYRSVATVGWLSGLSLLVVLGALLGWFGGWWLRRRYRSTLVFPAALQRLRLLSRLGALVLLLAALGWLVLIVVISADELILLQGAAVPWMYALHALDVVALLGVLAIVAHAVRQWQLRLRGLRVRIGETLLALAALYLGWVILAFGLVSFNMHF